MSNYPDFTFAHTGLNVADMDAAVSWYVENLNLSVARRVEGVMTFLADPTGRVILELYANPSEAVLDFSSTHWLTFHLAFLADDPELVADRLVAAGATVSDAYKVTPSGDRMIMLQDPFGLSIQLIQRSQPMF